MCVSCKDCDHPGRDCLNRLLAFTPEELLTWCKAMKRRKHLSNQDLAELTNMSKSTVDRIFGPGQYTEYRYSTIRPIIFALAGVHPQDMHCEKAPTDEAEHLQAIIQRQEASIERLTGENEYYQNELTHRDACAREDPARAKEEEAESLAYLKKENKLQRRAIYILAGLTAGLLLLIIAALLWDAMDQGRGFFWLRSLFNRGNDGLIGRM